MEPGVVAVFEMDAGSEAAARSRRPRALGFRV